VQLKTFIREKKNTLAILALSLIIFVPVLVQPLSFDNAINQVISLDWIRYGRIPYLQSVDHNFPGIIYLQTIGILLVGSSDISFRIFDLFLESSFVVFTFLFFRKYLDDRIAGIGAILYALYYVSGGSILYGQRDIYATMLLFIAISLSFPLIRLRDSRRVLFSGVFVGLSILFRPTSAVFLIPLCLGIYWNQDKAKVYRKILLLVSAAAVPILIVILYYSFLPGGIKALWSLAIKFNVEVHSKIPSSDIFWRPMLKYIFVLVLSTLGLYSGSIHSLKYSPSYVERLFLKISVLLSILIVVVQGKNFPNHFATFFMFLIPFAAIGIDQIVRHIINPLRQFYAVVLCCLICFIQFNPISLTSFLLGILEKNDPFHAVQELDSDTLYGSAVQDQLIRYVNQRSGMSDEVEICSLNPTVRLHLQRKCAGYFPSLHPLAETPNSDKNNNPIYSDDQKEWQTDYVRSIAAERPLYVILASEMKYWAVKDFSKFLHSLPNFDSILNSNYTRECQIGGFEIYRRNSS